MVPHADHIPGPEDRLPVHGHSVVSDHASSERPHQGYGKGTLAFGRLQHKVDVTSHG